MERYPEVTQRRRQSSPSSSSRHNLTRPRSLVFTTPASDSANENQPEENHVIKKYKSVSVLRQHSVSPRHEPVIRSSYPVAPPRIYRTGKPVLNTNVSPSKVRERIRQMNTSRNLERGSRSLPRKATRRMDAHAHARQIEDFEDYETNFEMNAEALSWSDSD